MRPSCHDCQYTNINRPADITLADFWGYKETSFQDQDNDQGISMVMINNENGENLFNLSKNNLKAFHRTLEDAVQGNQALKKCFPPNKNREQFWNDFRNSSFDYIVKKYLYEEDTPSWALHRLDNIKNIRKNILKDKIIHFPNRKLIKILGVDKYNKLKSMLKQ